jgi:oligopeptide/dipeptide ABC transporter ATP-binding protein
VSTGSTKELLRAEHLVKEFPVEGHKKGDAVHAVSDVSFSISEGETLALVGESGCGKSTLGRCLIRLLPLTSGKVYFDGQDITAMNERQFRPVRRQMQIIFQDPYASLDPRMTVEKIIAEPLRANKVCKTKEELEEKVLSLMDMVEIPREYLRRYPHQFSGGQRQRIGIARALALEPRLVVCDEPVSALDVSIQSQVLNLLDDLQDQKHLTYLFISHDLSVVRHISDRICVMFLGRLCEIGPTAEIYDHPLHPYTKFLLASVPSPDPTKRDDAQPLLTGDIPSPVNPPSGCVFRTRCPYADAQCAAEVPQLRSIGGHEVACHHPLG